MGIDRPWVWGFLFLILGSCGEMSSEPPGLSFADRKQIAGFRDAYRLAVMSGDAEAIRAGFAPQALVLPHGGEMVQGTEALRKYCETFVQGPKPTELEFTPVDIYGVDGLAYEVGAFRRASAPLDGDGDKIISVTGSYFWVFKKQPDGDWKLAAAMTNTTQPLSDTDNQ